MIKQLCPVTLSQMIEDGGIYIEKLSYGFDHYNNQVLTLGSLEYEQLLYQGVALNGEEHSYFDFYYSRLPDENKNEFYERLSQEERNLFQSIVINSDHIYYPLRKEIIPFVNAITANELLFSTFYFTKYPITIWGNYGLKYPVFYKENYLHMYF